MHSLAPLGLLGRSSMVHLNEHEQQKQRSINIERDAGVPTQLSHQSLAQRDLLSTPTLTALAHLVSLRQDLARAVHSRPFADYPIIMVRVSGGVTRRRRLNESPCRHHTRFSSVLDHSLHPKHVAPVDQVQTTASPTYHHPHTPDSRCSTPSDHFSRRDTRLYRLFDVADSLARRRLRDRLAPSLLVSPRSSLWIRQQARTETWRRRSRQQHDQSGADGLQTRDRCGGGYYRD
jgi:hypothetical protein